MRPGQTLVRLTTRAMDGLERFVSANRPDVVVVQGDTSTSFAIEPSEISGLDAVLPGGGWPTGALIEPPLTGVRGEIGLFFFGDFVRGAMGYGDGIGTAVIVLVVVGGGAGQIRKLGHHIATPDQTPTANLYTGCTVPLNTATVAPSS